MDHWTTQAGFPIIIVEEKDPEEEGTRVFELTQERFLSDGSKDDAKSSWFVPISVVSARIPDQVIKLILK